MRRRKLPNQAIYRRLERRNGLPSCLVGRTRPRWCGATCSMPSWAKRIQGIRIVGAIADQALGALVEEM
jgi:hypothetical protein